MGESSASSAPCHQDARSVVMSRWLTETVFGAFSLLSSPLSSRPHPSVRPDSPPAQPSALQTGTDKPSPTQPRFTARNTRGSSAHPRSSSVCLFRHDRTQARDMTRHQRNSQQCQQAPTSPHRHNWSTARNPLSSPASRLPFRHPKTEIHKSSGRAPARAAAARRTSPKARDLVTR